MGEAKIEIRNMTRGEIGLAVDWAAKEGWNPGLNDAEAFWAADPGGFLLAVQDAKPVGCVSLVRYEGGFAFLGLFIVIPELRGRGIGIALSTAALELAGGSIVGLDGVVAQQKNYQKMGFKWHCANRRYQGTGGGESPGGLTPLADIAIDRIAELDRECFGYERAAFLKRWLDQPDGAALGKLEGGDLRGFGVLRPCREGYKVGPLFAERPDTAHDIFHGLTSSAGEQPVFLDVPEPNRQAVKLAESHGMVPVFETARMYLNGDPGLPLEKIFGVTSFELG